MGEPELQRRYADGASRQINSQELDQILASWTLTRNAGELATQLRECGVATFKSLSSIDLIGDEHLWKRGFYTHVTDNKQRSTPIVGAPWRMSATPAVVQRAAPILGEHNDYVLGELLGLSAEERQRLIEQKIVY
jgi:crotonobetainyl-CoA:carnitine CoA-transferase CaiB-like acyl-CoA transferase